MQNWNSLYSTQIGQKRLFPEGFVLRSFLSSYPARMVPRYENAKALDLSCGYGRNLPLLLSMEYQVFATEVDDQTVAQLQDQFPQIDCSVGVLKSLPFSNDFFDVILACNSCYYLETDLSFTDNLSEIFRILRPGGCFVGSIVGHQHSILNKGEYLSDGSVQLSNQQLNFRNSTDALEGTTRLQTVSSADELTAILREYAADIHVGHIVDTLHQFTRDLYYFTCIKNNMQSSKLQVYRIVFEQSLVG